MGVYTENLLRARSSGYGGTGVGSAGDDSGIYGSLLAGGAENLNTKRYDAEQALAQKRFDELVKEQDRRFQMDLINKGYGTDQQISSIVNSAFNPEGATGIAGSASAVKKRMEPADLEKLTSIYGSLTPYINRINPGGGGINNLYDPGKANLYESLKKQIGLYGRN